MNFITPLHRQTRRDYIGRMTDDKIKCMQTARRYGKDFWDGARRYGYGGYRYDGRWQSVAEKMIDHYALDHDARILDVGCGKAYLLYEFKKLLPDVQITGFDLSSYAIENSKKEIRSDLFVHKAQDPYPYEDKAFDLVISLTTLHNLYLHDLKAALQEIERVGRNKYVAVESYRNESELFNLQCWALTCESFFTPAEWVWMFAEFGYKGDYEFIYFE